MPTFYGQNELDRILYEKYFKDKRNGFFVECGAVDGILDTTCKFFEDELGWTGINIEPVRRLYKLLQQNRPNCNNIMGALSNEHKRCYFTEAIFKKDENLPIGLGSIDLHNNKVEDDLFRYSTSQTICYKFSQLFTQPRVIDLFVLDVEGHELEAIDGILEISKEFYPIVFCIEKGWINTDKLQEKLEPYYSLDENNEIDMFFKRKY